MAVSLWFLVVLGAAALRVETDTPNALCPPLEQVREAVRSRLGEVEGGPYEARFTVVRGGDQGDMLVLTVTAATEGELMRRELPLASVGCAEAAEIVALVLERFFQQMSAAESPSRRPDPEPNPEQKGEREPKPRQEPKPNLELPRQQPGALTVPAREPPNPSDWRLRGGVAVHSEPAFGAALGASYRVEWMGLILDATWPLGERRSQEESLSLGSESAWLFGSLVFLLESGRWSGGVGPLAALQFERAEIEGASELSAGPKSRFVAGAGAHTVGRFALSDSLELEAGFRLSPMLTQAAPRFVVIDVDGHHREVLRPRGLPWTGSVGLNLKIGGDS